jgi:glycosyltransferase involved in cell wall biosynthesis/Tfp pilus assembly protein PilF
MMNSSDHKEPMEEPTISLCMMIKDEEEMLPRCLSSVKKYVDEIIVVDTGSTDNSVSIAESFGAKVYHHPWEEDFSKHRNQSISHATGDWFLILDADEEIIEGTGSLIKDAVGKKGVDSISFQVISLYAGGNKSLHTQERLFRNHIGIHYEERIHNRIAGSKVTCLCPVKVLHHGYNVQQEKAKRKHERRLRLLQREMEDDPKNPVPHHYLAASYLSVPQYEKAAQEALVALVLADEIGEAASFFYAWTHYIASSALFYIGRLEDAWKICLLGLKRFPEDPDIRFIACQIAFATQDSNRLTVHAAIYTDLWARQGTGPEAKRMTQWVTYDQTWRVAWFLAMDCKRAGLREDFNRHMKKALQMAPKKGEVFLATARYLLEEGDLEEARIAVDRGFVEDSLNEGIIFLQIELYMRLNDEINEIRWWQELLQRFPEKKTKMTEQAAQAIKDGQPGHAKKLLEALWAKYPEDATLLRLRLRLVWLFIEKRHFDEAWEYLQEVVALDDNNSIARLGQAVVLCRKGDLESCAVVLAKAMQRIETPVNIEADTSQELGIVFAAAAERLIAMGEPMASACAYETALELECFEPDVYLGLAKALEAQGRLEEALCHLRDGLQISANPTPILRHMGDVYASLGNSQAAEFCYRKSQPFKAPSSPPTPS